VTDHRLPVLDPPQTILVRAWNQPRCDKCHGEAVTVFHIVGDGYSVSADHAHEKTCSGRRP
jgi:hypothetical protein